MLSIIIPVYNAEQYLPELMRCFQYQNGTFEVIFVDNGSEDNSLSLCKEYRNRYKFVRFTKEERRGSLYARLRGLSIAFGDHFWFIDAEDIIPDHAVDEIENIIQIYDPDILFFKANDKKYIYPETSGFLSAEEIKTHLEDLILQKTPNALWNKVFSKRVIEEKKYSENIYWGEDLMQSLPYYNNAEKIYFYNEVLYLYQDNATGITKNFKPDTYASIREADIQLLEYSNLWSQKWKIDPIVAERFYQDIWMVIKKLTVSEYDPKDILIEMYEDKEFQKISNKNWFLNLLYKGKIRLCTFLIKVMRKGYRFLKGEKELENSKQS